MNKKFALLAFLLLTALLLVPRSTSAHVLIKDESGSAGAVMHIMPDDDPIAGEEATLFFDVHGSAVTDKSARATLTIASELGVESKAPVQVTGSRVSASYVFPLQGLYKIKLSIEQDGQKSLIFLQSKRVTRGTAADTSVTTSPPAWAQIGMLTTSLAAATTTIIIINRRAAISRYSKFGS